jgi:hypothetical protein
MLILLACQWLHTHAATEPQGNRIHGGQTPLQFVAIVAGLHFKHRQYVDVTVRPSRGLPLVGKLTSWPLANLTKIGPRSCHAFRARSAKVLGPLLFDEFEVVIDEFLRSREHSDVQSD